MNDRAAADVFELIERERVRFVNLQFVDILGTVKSVTVPVHRFFDGRVDANHRYTIDLSVFRSMINRGWAVEGAGAGGVVFCSPV